MFGALLMLLFSILLPLACKSGGDGPSSPSGQGGGGPQPLTATSTSTSTPTITPTPNCLDATPIATTSINGPDIVGNDSTDFPPMDLDGTGPNGDVYTFTLSSPATLNFSLCPTDDFDRDTYLILRSNYCWNKPDTFFNDDACDFLSEITGASLAVGTYYLIVTENGGDGPNQYTLRVTSGTSPGPVCTASPTSTPQAVSQGQHPTCSLSYDLGNSGPLNTGDSVATGNINDDSDTDDWYSFVTANGGPVTVILDCFDNGLGKADLDIYGYSACPIVGSSVGSSTTQNATESFTFTANAGVTYYIDANAYFGGGSYRLTVQTP